MHVEDSGNHTGTTSKDEFYANENASKNRKRQKPEDERNEDEQKQQSDILYQRPKSKRLKSTCGLSRILHL